MSFSAEAHDQLHEIARIMRESFEAALTAAERTRDPAGTCALASVLVHTAVTRFTAYPAIIRGGNGELGEGARARDGSWQGHYWVEVDVDGTPVVLDITADQFGWGNPVLAPVAQLLERYRPGDQEAVDDHMAATREWIAEGSEPA